MIQLASAAGGILLGYWAGRFFVPVNKTRIWLASLGLGLLCFLCTVAFSLAFHPRKQPPYVNAPFLSEAQSKRLQPSLSEKLGYATGKALALYGLGCIGFAFAFGQRQLELLKRNAVPTPQTVTNMTHTPWLERTFNFDFPVSHFPFISERLRGTAPRIEELIEGLTDAQLSERRDGKWSLKEHIGHLIDLEELHEGRIDDFRNRAEVLRAADMSNKKTESADHNRIPSQELLIRFRNTRQHFLDRLYENEALLGHSAIHPRLKKQMRLVDMAFFVCEHDDHHLVLMRKALPAL